VGARRWASDGTPFEIQFGRHRADATVAMRPFYDPDGARLRS
jgi:glycine cleavage system aminomethyltransferase T